MMDLPMHAAFLPAVLALLVAVAIPGSGSLRNRLLERQIVHRGRLRSEPLALVAGALLVVGMGGCNSGAEPAMEAVPVATVAPSSTFVAVKTVPSERPMRPKKWPGLEMKRIKKKTESKSINTRNVLPMPYFDSPRARGR